MRSGLPCGPDLCVYGRIRDVCRGCMVPAAGEARESKSVNHSDMPLQCRPVPEKCRFLRSGLLLVFGDASHGFKAFGEEEYSQ